MEDIDQQEETGRYTHLVPDYNFDGDRDAVIMKMTRSELAAQINKNNQALKRITEYTAKLYSRDLGLQAEDWRKKYKKEERELKDVKVEFTSMMALWSCYGSSMSNFMKDMNKLVARFNKESSPIIGKDILVGEDGTLFNFPELKDMQKAVARFKKRKKETSNEDKEQQEKDSSGQQSQEEDEDNYSTDGGEDNSKDDDASQPLLDGDESQQDEASPLPATADFRKLLQSQLEK